MSTSLNTLTNVYNSTSLCVIASPIWPAMCENRKQKISRPYNLLPPFLFSCAPLHDAPDTTLTPKIPYLKFDILIVQTLNIESNRRNGRNNLTQLQLVQDGCFARTV